MLHHRRHRARSRWALATAALAVAATTQVALAPSASAGGYAHVQSNSGGAYIRAKPTTDSMFYAYVGNGTQVYLYCWVDDQWATGNYRTNRWFQSNVPTYQYGSPEAYIHASLIPVSAQPTLPHC